MYKHRRRRSREFGPRGPCRTPLPPAMPCHAHATTMARANECPRIAAVNGRQVPPIILAFPSASVSGCLAPIANIIPVGAASNSDMRTDFNCHPSSQSRGKRRREKVTMGACAPCVSVQVPEFDADGEWARTDMCVRRRRRDHGCNRRRHC